MYRHPFSVCAVVALMAFAGATSLPATGNTETADPHTTIDVANDGVSVVFMVHSAHSLLSLTVRVAGPDGALVFERRVESPMVEWIPEGELDDGALYQWEARAVTAAPGAQRSAKPNAHDRLSQQHGKAAFSAGSGFEDTGAFPIEALYAETDKRVDRASGMLRVESGLLVEPAADSGSVGVTERLMSALLDFLVPAANAGQNFSDFVQVQDTGNDHHTYLALYSDDNSSWWLNNEGGDFRIEELDSIGVPIAHRLTVEPGGNLGLGTTQPQDPIHIRHAGPVIRFNDSNNEQTWQLMATEFGYRVADQTAGTLPFYIQPDAPSDALFVSTNGNIGLGTNTPTQPVHIVDDGPAINFDDANDALLMRMLFTQGTYSLRNMTDGKTPAVLSMMAPSNSFHMDQFGRIGMGTNSQSERLTIQGNSFGPSVGFRTNTGTKTWSLGAAMALMYFWDEANGRIPFAVASGAPVDSLRVDSNGKVGIGTASPANPIHVRKGDGSAQILVEDSGGTDGQTMFSLLNSGGHPKFRLEDASQSNVRWEFRTAGTEGASERFQVNKIGSGVLEFQLNAGGSAEFAGDVRAQGVLLTSAREMKTDFAAVDLQAILEKISALEITEWRYKRDDAGRRHIGPMADDFTELFGMGDGRHISAGDANGVLFAAIKALKLENESLRHELADIQDLRTKVGELNTAVERLQSAD